MLLVVKKDLAIIAIFILDCFNVIILNKNLLVQQIGN